jgi:hypothetical protein
VWVYLEHRLKSFVGIKHLMIRQTHKKLLSKFYFIHLCLMIRVLNFDPYPFRYDTLAPT